MTAAAMPRLRALCFAHLIESDGPGGAERMLASMVTELQSAGSENLVIAPAAGEGWIARELIRTGARVELFRAGLTSVTFVRWLMDTLRRYDIDLVHSHEFTMAAYGAWAARLVRIPHLFTMHGSRYYAGRLQRRIALRLAAFFSSSIVTVSQSLGRYLARDLFIRPSHIVTIPNGVRLPALPTQSSLREELGLQSSDHLAVAVGNLYPVKGHSYLLEALALLATRCPRLHVAIAGRGQLEQQLRERARELQVSDRFHLLGLRSDIGNVLAGADVFVLPSLSEGTPLALLEAMLTGRPIIASAVGEVPIVLDGGRVGLLVPAADAAALARALEALLSDPARSRELGAAARMRVTEAYGFDAMMSSYLALYTRALGNHPYNRGSQGVRHGQRQALPDDRPPGKRTLVR